MSSIVRTLFQVILSFFLFIMMIASVSYASGNPKNEHPKKNPKPKISIEYRPAVIAEGGSVDVRWQTQFADQCDGDLNGLSGHRTFENITEDKTIVIECQGENGISRRSVTVRVKLKAPKVPDIVIPQNDVTDNDGLYHIAWDKPKKTKYFQLKENGELIAEHLTHQKKVFQQENNGAYCYQVSACKKESVCSVFSEPRCVTVEIPAPKILFNEVPREVGSDETIVLSATTEGTQISDLDFYYRYLGQVEEHKLSDAQMLDSVWSAAQSLLAGDYEIWVRAYYAGTYIDSDARSLSVRTRPAVPSMSIDPPDGAYGNYGLNWSLENHATQYIVEEKINASTWDVLAAVVEPPYAFQNKGDGLYAYRVSACNESVCSQASEVAEVDIDKPPLVRLVSQGWAHVANEPIEFYATAEGVDVSSLEFYYQVFGQQEEHLIDQGVFDAGQWKINAQFEPGDYYLFAKAYYRDGLRSQKSFPEYIGVHERPTPVTQILGPDKLIEGEVAGFVWNISQGADQYYWELHYVDQGIVETGYSYSAGMNTEYKYSGQLLVRVQGCKFDICSEFFEVSFNVIPVPKLISPSNLEIFELGQPIAIVVEADVSQAYTDIRLYYQRSDDNSNTQGSLPLSDAGQGRYEGTLILEGRPGNRLLGVGAYWQGDFISPKYNTEIVVNSPITSVPAPQIETVMPKESYTVSWDEVEGVTHYILEEEYSGGRGWEELMQTSEVSHIFSNNELGEYRYRVTACEASICSATSAASRRLIVFESLQVSIVDPLDNAAIDFGDALIVQAKQGLQPAERVELLFKQQGAPDESIRAFEMQTSRERDASHDYSFEQFNFAGVWLLWTRSYYADYEVTDSEQISLNINGSIRFKRPFVSESTLLVDEQQQSKLSVYASRNRYDNPINAVRFSALSEGDAEWLQLGEIQESSDELTYALHALLDDGLYDLRAELEYLSGDVETALVSSIQVWGNNDAFEDSVEIITPLQGASVKIGPEELLVIAEQRNAERQPQQVVLHYYSDSLGEQERTQAMSLNGRGYYEVSLSSLPKYGDWQFFTRAYYENNESIDSRTLQFEVKQGEFLMNVQANGILEMIDERRAEVDVEIPLLSSETGVSRVEFYGRSHWRENSGWGRYATVYQPISGNANIYRATLSFQAQDIIDLRVVVYYDNRVSNSREIENVYLRAAESLRTGVLLTVPMRAINLSFGAFTPIRAEVYTDKVIDSVDLYRVDLHEYQQPGEWVSALSQNAQHSWLYQLALLTDIDNSSYYIEVKYQDGGVEKSNFIDPGVMGFVSLTSEYLAGTIALDNDGRLTLSAITRPHYDQSAVSAVQFHYRVVGEYEWVLLGSDNLPDETDARLYSVIGELAIVPGLYDIRLSAEYENGSIEYQYRNQVRLE